MKKNNENFSKLSWEVIERYSSSHNDNGDAIKDDIFLQVERSKVFGGWLIRSTLNSSSQRVSHNQNTVFGIGNSKGIGVGLTFIPDPSYEWKLK